jgi:hypothetical protein
MKLSVLRLAAPILFAALGAVGTEAQSLSFSTDFDGTGMGGSVSFSRFRPSGNYGNNPYASFEYERYQAQQAEARKREELKKRIEEARQAQRVGELSQLLAALDQLDDSNETRRYQLKYKVLTELEPKFREEQTAAAVRQRDRIQKLMYQADHISVPSPAVHYESVFIGGMTYSPAEALADTQRGLANPFDGRRFDLIVGAGRRSWADLARAIEDHFLGEGNLLSLETVSQVRRLKNAVVNQIVCHSNGCAIARVLVATGYVKGVKKLRVLGGDESITNLDAYASLSSTSGTDVRVYAVIGDPVPLSPTGWQILDAMKKIGLPLESLSATSSLTYQVLGLTRRKGYDPSSTLHVQMLSPLVKDEPALDRHLFRNYFGIITGQRMIGALQGNGDLVDAAVIRSSH